MKLTFKIILGFILLIVLMAAANIYSTSYMLESLQEERLKTSEVIFAKSLARRLYRAVIEERINRITDVLFEEKSLREEKIEYIIVFDKKGYLLAHTYLSNMPKKLIKIKNAFVKGEEYRLEKIQGGELSVYNICVPVMEGIKQVGTIHVGIRSDYVHNIITPTKTASNLSLIITFIITLIAVIIAIPLSQTITNPLLKLKKLVEKISKGNLETHIDIKTKDEIGDLANAFNKMTVDLHKTITSLDREIIERKRAEKELKVFAEKLEQSNEELRKFLSIASHDLQEPLRKVMTFGDRLQSKYAEMLDDQGRDYLERLQRATGRMRILIYDLLLFSQITVMDRPLEQVDLGVVVQKVLFNLEGRIKETGARVEVGELPTIEADPRQMPQLLHNLIGNSLEYRKKDEPPVIKVNNIHIHNNDNNSDSTDPDNDFYQITVEDNGIGFDEKYAKRIFGVFQRLHGRGEYEGTGIGLSVCKKIVECHGGSITAKSAPGQGATFTVSLPVKQIKGLQ